MGVIRIAIFAVAAVAAIGLALLVHGAVSPKPAPAPVAAAAPAPAPKPMARVLVARTDLPVGTRLTPEHMAWQEWPIDALNANFVTDGGAVAPAASGVEKAAQKATAAASQLVSGGGPMEAFSGAIVKEALLAREPITARKVVRGGEGGYMAVVLQPGMRAMSIPVSSETGAGGFILPGDRVDVLQSRTREGAKEMTTEVLLQNVRVLAIDQNTQANADAKSIVGGVATLEVPAADAGVLTRGKAQGEMMLALRPFSDAGGPIGRGGSGVDSAKTVRVVRAGEATEIAVR